MSFHSFVPAEPVEAADEYEPDPVQVSIVSDKPLGLLFNGVALEAEDTIRLPIAAAPLSIYSGKCRYLFTLNGDEREGVGYFARTDAQGLGRILLTEECELEIANEPVTVRITGLEFSRAGIKIICTALSDIED